MRNQTDALARMLEPATLIALSVDQENGAPEFWNAVETIPPPDADAARLREMNIAEPLVVTSDQARRLLAWAVTLPDWNAEDAPEFAPHPLLFQDAEDVKRLQKESAEKIDDKLAAAQLDVHGRRCLRMGVIGTEKVDLSVSEATMLADWIKQTRQVEQ